MSTGDSTVTGYGRGKVNTTGSSNTVHGYSALSGNTTGKPQCSIGDLSRKTTRAGSFNTAIGAETDVKCFGQFAAIGDQGIA